MVAALKNQGVDGIKAVLDDGFDSLRLKRLDPALLKGAGDRARALGIPMVVHTATNRDILDAVAAGASAVEHGSASEPLSEETLRRLVEARVYYDATLTVLEGIADRAARRATFLDRSLVEQAAPPGLIAATRKSIAAGTMTGAIAALAERAPERLRIAKENAVRAYKAGVLLVTGSDAGNMPVVPGPTVQRELALLVDAGVPHAAALQAATVNAAALLGIARRTGAIKPGHEATLLIVDGNPLRDITATERISEVFFKGEAVARGELFDQR
jgi:imidazolonepropionase-like amidohydrolase